MKLFTALTAALLIAAPAQAQVSTSHTIVNPDGSGFTCQFIGNTTYCNEESATTITRRHQLEMESHERKMACFKELGLNALRTRRMDECLKFDPEVIKATAERMERRCQELLQEGFSMGVIPKREWHKECSYNL